ncbi:MAG: methyltransferase domain-containing protein [Chitinophagaceae bacterium]|nr:MAG: methyltransferase domain-containing protein [Chitinophagaceae bacterium]
MDLKKKAAEFSLLLKSIKADEICAAGYARKYLEHLTANSEFYTAIYRQVLSDILANSGKKAGEINMVDYGCGNGLLGLFAWYCGFSKIIFQDVDEEFLTAAKNLCERFDADKVSFVHGEIGLLINQRQSIDAIAGTDVIEHIYDLVDFFSIVRTLNPAMVTVFTTAANPFNPLIRKRLRSLHVQDEIVGGDGSGLSGNAHPPFLEARYRLISEKFPKLENARELAVATRGLAGIDIKNAVQQYQLTKHLPVPAHESNTCDPLTGNWTERLLTGDEYADLFNKYGFSIEIKAGFYNSYREGAKGILAGLLNNIVSVLGKTFSPFIIITGRKK